MTLHDVKFKLDSGKETDRKVRAVLKRTKTSNAFFWIVNNEDTVYLFIIDSAQTVVFMLN